MSRKKLKRRRIPSTKPGRAPGTITIAADALKPVIDVTRYSADTIDIRENVDVDSVPKPTADAFLWVNVVGLGDKEIIQKIAARFEIHDLALKDVVNTHQRPKIDEFDDHLFIVTRLPQVTDDELDVEQVSIFLGKRYVLTWQERPGDCFSMVRTRLQSPHTLVRTHGSDFLVYAFVDSIVDSYFPLLTLYTDRMDAIEDEIKQSEIPSSVIHELHTLRTDIQVLRRDSSSHRDMVRKVMRYEGELLQESTRLHLRDVEDHAFRLVELLESSREGCSELRDLYMSAVSLRMNEVMKVLTIIATIFIPLGFIAGVYGMNFSNEASPWNMPETQWYLGYPLALLLMATVGGAMVWFFVRRGWIGNRTG